MKVTFKNSKTKKSTTKKYRCVVKAKEKVDESYKITSASATGVKTITVELNKAVADATKVTKVDVKKGTAARASKFTVDGSKIVIAMDDKLTSGAYTVTVEGLETTALTADVNVEKDETLTSFEISDYIVAKSQTKTTEGAIKFAALNQYGEKMVSADPTATCSFGAAKIDKSATATAEGVIKVDISSPMFAIVGTKGTVVLVGEMGVTATKEISYNTAATTATAEVAGTYHINSATIKSITEGDKVGDYELLLTAKDQYGYDVDIDLFKEVNVTIAGGLTNITVDASKGFKTRTVNGVDYIAVSLKAITGSQASAGDATLSIINPYKGMVLTTTITVSKNVVIKSINLTAPNGVYAGQPNELSYEIIDADGKNVTSYAVLSSGIIGFDSKIKLQKNADGTAKILYEPVAKPEQANTDKASLPEVVNVTANSPIGGDYFVKTFSFTVYQERYAKSVSGIAADQTTSISIGNKGKKALEIPSSKFVLADQYSNKVVSTDKMFNDKIYGGTTDGTGTAIYVATNDAIDVNIDTVNKKIIATPAAVGTATVYLKYCYDSNNVTANPSSYDARFSISVYDTAGVDTGTLEIKSINDGFTVKSGTTGTALTKAQIKVVAKVGGTETVIPESQFEIVKCENYAFTNDEVNRNVMTKTAKVTVQVTTWDSANTNIETQVSKEYQVSRAAAKAFKVTKAKGATSASITVTSDAVTYNASNFVNSFEFKDQYGAVLTADSTNATSVLYTIELISATDRTGYTISASGLNTAKVQVSKGGTYVFKITAKTDDGSTKDYQFTVTAN